MRFVSPETVRIDLKDGPDGEKNWIQVKKFLTVGEDKRFRTKAFRGVRPDRSEKIGTGDEVSPEIGVDWPALSFGRVLAYLVDWSAKKPSGKDLPVSETAIEKLEPEDFEEIDQAISDHIENMEAEKKQKAG